MKMCEGSGEDSYLTFLYGNFVQFHGWRGSPHWVTRWNGQKHIHAGKYLPEYAVFSIQPGGGNVGDEELAAICARAGICH
jgi:hypothetical protein